MSHELLSGKRGIIFGALDEHSIAWKVAERVHAEGGSIVLTNAPIAMRMGEINKLAEKTNSQILIHLQMRSISTGKDCCFADCQILTRFANKYQ